jgi:hypothetical protein
VCKTLLFVANIFQIYRQYFAFSRPTGPKLQKREVELEEKEAQNQRNNL